MAKTKIFHDVTLDFSPDTPIYPGDPEVNITEHMSISNGDIANVSILTFGSHTGTHIDAPKHFVDSGPAVDELPLEHFIGKAKVFEVKDKDAITEDDLKGFDIQRGDLILLKTRNSAIIRNNEFDTGFAYVTAEAARYLAYIGIKTLGYDYFSIEEYGSKDFGAHLALLGKGAVLIEGLDLGDIRPGEYEMVALPVKIKNGNGSPVRVILMEEDK